MSKVARPGSVVVPVVMASLMAQWGCMPSDGSREIEKSEWARIKIVLDPGHGGKDAGASRNGAAFEKDVVLDIALRVEQLLQRKGMHILLTRRSDAFIPLSERAEIANKDDATLFVSIHANSCPREEVSGFEIYYGENGKERQSIQAANFLQQTLRKATHATDRGVRKYSYAVLARTQCPSVLIEVGYLSNPREARLLSSRSYRRRLADGMARGIIAYAKTRL